MQRIERQLLRWALYALVLCSGVTLFSRYHLSPVEWPTIGVAWIVLVVAVTGLAMSAR